MKSQWITHYEKSGFTGSPRYDESMDFFKQFTVHTRFASMFPIGISPQGRSIECIVVAKGKEFTPEKAKKKRKSNRSYSKRHPCRRDRGEGFRHAFIARHPYHKRKGLSA
jgi:hypothetical protein